ncbi:MAG: hypothetical protein RSE00_01875 [Clostridia bacterium]
MKKNTKKGVSLIALVITIIVGILLVSVVVLSLRRTNIISNSVQTKFQTNVKTYETELNEYISNKEMENAGRYNKTLYADRTMSYYDSLKQEKVNIKTIIPSIKDEDLSSFIVKDSELVYIGNDPNEKLWAADIVKILGNENAYIKDGLILHWDAIKNTGTTHDNKSLIWKDLSGNGNDGIITGITDTFGSGWSDNKISLDGIDDVIYKYMNISGSNACIEIVASYYSGSYIARSDANYRTYFQGNNAYIKGEPPISVVDSKIVDQNPHSRVLQWRTKNNELYLDVYSDSKKIGDSVKFTNNNNGTYFSLGSYKPVPDQLAKIDVYSVRIYNRALSDEEVNMNYTVDAKRYGIKGTN